MVDTRKDELHPATTGQLNTLPIICTRELKPRPDADAECSICQERLLDTVKDANGDKAVIKFPRCGNCLTLRIRNSTMLMRFTI